MTSGTPTTVATLSLVVPGPSSVTTKGFVQVTATMLPSRPASRRKVEYPLGGVAALSRLRSKGRRRTFAAAVAALAVVTVPLAWASHRFADVPADDQFHANIDALAGSGVTRGCNPPANTLYCPNDPVTRAQMAAFLHRGLSRVTSRELAVGSLPRSWSIPITPGLPADGPANFIKVDATVTVAVDTATGCPCAVDLIVAMDGSPITQEESYVSVFPGERVTIPITAAVKVTVAGQRLIQLTVDAVDGGTVTGTAFGNATVTTYPFGYQGTNELAPSP